MRKTYEATVEAVELMLHNIPSSEEEGPCDTYVDRLILTNPGEEKEDLDSIRTTYLPEIILAYNTVLCTAGHMITRDELLRAMDLAPLVADDKSLLNKAFNNAGRITELLQGLAQTSVIMLKLNETGKPRKEKRGRQGRNLDIWQMTG